MEDLGAVMCKVGPHPTKQRTTTTHQIAPQRVVDFVHGTRERVKLGARVSALLQLALQPAKDVVESKATLPRQADIPAHSAHANQTLLLQCWSALSCPGDSIGSILLAVEAEVVVTISADARLIRGSICWRALL